MLSSVIRGALGVLKAQAGLRLGSTLGLTDSSGTLLTEYTYEPFGNTNVSGAPNANPFQYTARENDGTGLATWQRCRPCSQRLRSSGKP